MTGGSAMGPMARATAGALVIVLFLSVSYVGGRVALGAWHERYRVQVLLGDLGQGVVRGTDVKMRGVIVGAVGDIALTDDFHAVAELVLDPRYPIPERSTFLVTGKTLLGEKQVEVVFDGPVDQGPFLADGSRVADPARVVEFEDVLANLARLVEAIDPQDLAVVVNDFFGAFDGMGPAIARSVDEGARAAAVFRGTLGDQIPATRDLSLVAESLGGAGREFNRLGEAVLEGLPVLSDNQQQLRSLLEQVRDFGDTLYATFSVNRADIDRMMVAGDNITRLLFHYRRQVGEVVSGLVAYSAAFDEGFTAPGVHGQAAYFEILLDGEGVFQTLCRQLPEPLAENLPNCDPVFAEIGMSGSEPIPMPLPRALVRPEVPGLGGLEALFRGLLLPASGGGAR